MAENNPAKFHKMYGVRKPRISYSKRDFLDYVLMIALCALAVRLSYGASHVMATAGLALCAFLLGTFIIRHGVELRTPVILRRPQDVLYMLLYKLENLRPMYFIALGLLLLETGLVGATPNLPHYAGFMRTAALFLFYTHFISITIFRTVILGTHLAKKELIREVLMQTPWKRSINERTNITLEILHAYATGMLAHILLIAPWYLVITHASYSVIFLPLVCLVDLVVHWNWIKGYNKWFYRDHWLGHNSEVEFLYLHGMHHDAIPSALIAVSDNGFLEGVMRYILGSPTSFYNPVIAFTVHMIEVKGDIERHQYIPGVFPKLSRTLMETFQHSTHHYLRLAPYSVGLKLDQPTVSEAYKKANRWFPDEITNSAKLDEELTGFQWDNPTQQKILSLYDKYQN